jgi:ribose/xylose/arabinose/galactoside ABC-type transport system permease subunit
MINRILSRMQIMQQEILIMFFLLLYIIISSIFIPYFASYENMVNILTYSASLILLSCGLTFVLLNGGLDLSIFATTGLASVVGAAIMNLNNGYLAKAPYSFLIAIFIMILIGLIAGAINGFSVVILKMPSFMATMATYFIIGGLALNFTQSATIQDLPKSFEFIANGHVLSIPVPIVIVIIFALLAHFLLSKTILGEYIYSVGTNARASLISGLPVKKIIFSLFLISGFYAALGSILMTARIGAGEPILGQANMLDGLAAVIIGGTSIFGGSGTIYGTVIGAVFITVLNTSLSMAGVSWYTISIFKGLIILLAVLLSALAKHRD